MTAAEGLYVSLEFTLTLDSGEVADRSPPGRPLGFVVGEGQVIRGLERGVVGLGVGERRTVHVEPEEGYGLPEPDMVRELPRDSFPPGAELRAGQGFTARGPGGPVAFRIQSFDDQTVWADFSHPLAGQRLHFDVTVLEVRPPQPGELPAAGCAPTDCAACGGGCGG